MIVPRFLREAEQICGRGGCAERRAPGCDVLAPRLAHGEDGTVQAERGCPGKARWSRRSCIMAWL